MIKKSCRMCKYLKPNIYNRTIYMCHKNLESDITVSDKCYLFEYCDDIENMFDILESFTKTNNMYDNRGGR